jgi:hypothetical protein
MFWQPANQLLAFEILIIRNADKTHFLPFLQAKPSGQAEQEELFVT